jgi:hypothetical protein
LSTTYHLCCESCHAAVWIAQRGSGNQISDMTLYSKDADAMERLRKFLIEHRGHALVFDDMETCFDRGLLENEQ